MVYQVSLRARVTKALEKINEPYYSRLKEAMFGLAMNPRPNGCKKLKGKFAYRIRVADYRIIYDILDDKVMIDVLDLGHRKDIYG